jgi:hypothetical protein
MMGYLLSTLDALCTELSRAFAQANEDPVMTGTREEHHPTRVFSYALPSQTKYGLRTIPYSDFYPDNKYRLSELDFRTPCYLTTRRSGAQRQHLLMIGRPTWLQRIYRAHTALLLEIKIADGALSYRFASTKTTPAGRRSAVWCFTLSDTQLAELRHALSVKARDKNLASTRPAK